MRGASEPIAVIMMVGLTIILGLLLLSFFNSSYIKVSSERGKLEYINSVKTSLDVIVVYSNSSRDSYSYVLNILNIGPSRLTFWVAFGVGGIRDPGVPVVTSTDNIEVYTIKSYNGIIDLNECPGNPIVCTQILGLLDSNNVYTPDEIKLTELGTQTKVKLKGFKRIELNSRESKLLYVKINKPLEYSEWPLILIMGNHNERYYVISAYKLPR
ncbi:MAG: hypothetical protein QXD97_01185 [Acidilobaceae archaeon]